MVALKWRGFQKGVPLGRWSGQSDMDVSNDFRVRCFLGEVQESRYGRLTHSL